MIANNILTPETILFEQEVHLSRRKAKVDEVVDRGYVCLKIVLDAGGSTFRFIGKFITSIFRCCTIRFLLKLCYCKAIPN